MCGLHAVGIEIGVFGVVHQLSVVGVALFEQRNGFLQIVGFLAPFVVEHLLCRQHLVFERVGKVAVTFHVVGQTGKLILVLAHLVGQSLQCRYSLVAVGHTFVDNIQRQFSGMLLAFPFLFHIFNQFFSCRTAAFVETWINGVFVGIDQLADLHAQQQTLAVALGDAESAEQFGGNLSTFVKRLDDGCGCRGVGAIVVGYHLLPVGIVVATLAVPGIAAPCRIPHPVAVNLQHSLAIGQFVGSVGPIPIVGLGIEMESFGMVNVVHGLDRLVDE